MIMLGYYTVVLKFEVINKYLLSRRNCIFLFYICLLKERYGDCLGVLYVVCLYFFF